MNKDRERGGYRFKLYIILGVDRVVQKHDFFELKLVRSAAKK
jgi:hypothetical protein